MLIYKTINNYICRYKLAMFLSVGAASELIDESLGISTQAARNSRKAKPVAYKAITVVKLLYLSALSGLYGNKTSTMQLKINDHDCTRTFTLMIKKWTSHSENV